MHGKCFSYCLGFFPSKCHPCMLTKSDSCRRLNFKKCKQHSMENIFQVCLGTLAGDYPEYRYQY